MNSTRSLAKNNHKRTKLTTSSSALEANSTLHSQVYLQTKKPTSDISYSRTSWPAKYYMLALKNSTVSLLGNLAFSLLNKTVWLDNFNHQNPYIHIFQPTLLYLSH